MKNIAFIINPISGSKETQNTKRKLPKLIMQTLDMELRSTQVMPQIWRISTRAWALMP